MDAKTLIDRWRGYRAKAFISAKLNRLVEDTIMYLHGESVEPLDLRRTVSELYHDEIVACAQAEIVKRDRRIEQLEAAISELQCDESYCGIHGKCPQCKAKTLLENKDE